jgi:hypothetical protein
VTSTPARPRALWAATGMLAGAQVPIPTVMSDNITQLAGIPETTAISMEFARTGPFAYVSSLDTISVLDLTDPKAPVMRGTLVNALFENESMTYGERVVGGELQRFVIAAVDLYQVSPDDVEHVNIGDGQEIVLVDVTDPDNPTIRSRTPAAGEPGAVSTSTHTVQCVDQADCRYAYSAGTDGEFSILDLSDLDAPKELRTVTSVAAGPAGPNSPFSEGGSGHYWDFDGELGWHTGSGGAEAFDVSDPTNPTPVTATNKDARTAPYNDFIFHNSMRPNASAFKAGAPPSVANGNVLLVTEEDYANEGDEIVCDRAGSFQTWYVPDLDAASYNKRNADGVTPDVGTITPLDLTNAPVEFAGGASTPVSAFCSAHWFDVHQDGFVALGHYGAGLRLLDVRDARNIKQFGHVTGVATQVWDAYWVPERDAAGVAIPGRKTNIVYTADAVRGIEVFEVALPAAAAGPAPAAPPAEQPPAEGPSTAPPASEQPGGVLAATGLSVGLPALALALMVGAAVVVRRRRTA